MKELEKISRTIDKEFPEARKETLLVIDATTGQNAISQAKLFAEVADVTGIILTKLDGTARGGVAVAVKKHYECACIFYRNRRRCRRPRGIRCIKLRKSHYKLEKEKAMT